MMPIDIIIKNLEIETSKNAKDNNIEATETCLKLLEIAYKLRNEIISKK